MIPSQTATIFVVAGDDAVRRTLAELVGQLGFGVVTFASAEDFLEDYKSERPGCLLLQLELPGMDGAQLLARLTADEVPPPAILVSAEADVAVVVTLMKAGAMDYLPLPCDPAALGESIRSALSRDAGRRRRQAERSDIRRRLARLTDEERLVMEMLLDGKPNKSIAAGLGLSRRTIDFRRATLMKKMQARNLVELAQFLMVVHPPEGFRWALPRAAHATGIAREAAVSLTAD